VAILGSLVVRESEGSRFTTMAMTLGGFGFSAYLTYRELFSIHAICEWCVSSAGIMTVLMILAVWRFLAGEQAGGLDRGLTRPRCSSPSRRAPEGAGRLRW
jgi:uncharacterized membrane protein